MSIFIIIFVTTVLHSCHFIHDREIIIVHFLGCRTITTFALTFAQLATCNIGLFTTAPLTAARILATAATECHFQ